MGGVVFSANRGSFAAATANCGFSPAWSLDAPTGKTARVREIHWGGGLNTATAELSRWVRPTTAGTGSGGPLTTGNADPNYATPTVNVYTTYAAATVLPALNTGELFHTAWNAFGGLGIFVLPPGMEWTVIGGVSQNQLMCVNNVAITSGDASFGLSWEE